jgi:hypothetical protein
MHPTLTKAVAANAEPETARYELKDTKVVGLRLIIQPSGAKSWAVRYTTPANEDRRFTLGSYPTIGLDDARKLADSVKRDVLVSRARKGNSLGKRGPLSQLLSYGVIPQLSASL